MTTTNTALRDPTPWFARPVLPLDRVARICALAVLLIGLVVLAGWTLKIEALTSVLPGLTSMKSNTALGLVLAGIALAQRRRRAVQLACAAAIIALAGLSLAQDLTGANFGTDEILFRDLPGAAQTVHPGRMSPITAIGLLLLGGALALLGSGRVALRRTLEALALLTLALALIALIGYAYDTEALFPLPGFGSMALLTPPGLALLALGILCARADGLAGVFVSAGLGGQVARRFLPLALIAPLFGGLVQLGEGAGLFDGTQGAAVFAAAMVLVLGALFWRNALALDASDAARQQAQALVARQAAELATLYATAPVGLFFFDTDLRYVRVNPAMAALNGLPADQHIGRTLRQLLTPELANDVETQVRQVLETGQPLLNCEVQGATAPRSAEQQRYWLVSYYPVQTGDGSICGVHGAVQEITARKQAEQALRKSEAFSRSIIKSSSDCIKVLDLEGHLLSMQTGQELLGIEDIAPFLNKSWIDFWEGAHDKRAAQAAVASAAAGGASAFVGFFRTPRGEAKWWDVLISPIFDADGQPTRLLAVSRDITEHKRAEQALRESEQRFRALFDHGPIAIYSCDAAGAIEEVNACAMQLWGRDPLRGSDGEQFGGSHKIYLPDGTPLVRAQSPMGKVLRGDIPAAYDQELLIERPDGSRISVIVNVVPLKNAQGHITGGMCCFYDITERSRLERKTLEQSQTLVDLDQRKDEFLAMLGHELRNPLAALSNAVQLLRLQKNEEPQQRQGRTIIERQVGQLKHLVDDLLEVSRIATGSVRLRREPVDVSGIVESALETVRPLIAHHRHTLTLALPQETIMLNADAARLEQVLVNLLTNAAKYTEDGGHIELSVAPDGESHEAVLRICDNGIGIAPDLLPHVFKLFTQAERSLDRAQGGLGIGLSLVQRLVELHGGSVKAHSTLGQGSEFVVRLPLMAAMPSAAALLDNALPALEAAAPPPRSCNVLIVDDNEDAARTLATILEMTGHPVKLAYDGLSALQAVAAHRPNVVLLDIGLPGIDGFEVARQIRQQAGLGAIVLVALTGYGREADRQLSKDAGFDHHLVKPASFIDIEKILASVAMQLA
jgi:PAS domain S-box-containing protein